MLDNRCDQVQREVGGRVQERRKQEEWAVSGSQGSTSVELRFCLWSVVSTQTTRTKQKRRMLGCTPAYPCASPQTLRFSALVNLTTTSLSPDFPTKQ